MKFDRDVSVGDVCVGIRISATSFMRVVFSQSKREKLTKQISH